MEVVTSLSELRTFRTALDGSLGLVPTMGYLHKGHLSLVHRARAENDWVGVSIFVNPTQFAPTEDLSAYPRDSERDLQLLREAGADVVWLPMPDEMYPRGFQTWVVVGELAQPLEGGRRRGHMRGVTTVVSKLFNAFTPDRAYFGQKDAQQALVIKRMVRDLNVPLEVVVCPIVREPDGLAYSSRNVYLNPGERQAATILHRALQAACSAWNNGERSGERLRAIMADMLNTEPLASPEYVSAADPDTLAEVDDIATGGVLLSMAVHLGTTRLIDNMRLGADG